MNEFDDSLRSYFEPSWLEDLDPRLFDEAMRTLNDIMRGYVPDDDPADWWKKP